MKFHVHLLLIFNICATNEENFINKALPNLEDLKNDDSFFFQLFKNQKNSEFLEIKQDLFNQKNIIFSFLKLDENKIISESKTKIDFLIQLIEIKKLLSIKNFCDLDSEDKKSKILEIKKEIANKDEYKNVFSSAENLDLNNNISYSKYINIKLEKDYKSVINKLNEPSSKTTNPVIKISSILIMIAAASALVYFFILIQAATISDNKEKVQTINIISSDKHIIKINDELLATESSCF